MSWLTGLVCKSCQTALTKCQADLAASQAALKTAQDALAVSQATVVTLQAQVAADAVTIAADAAKIAVDEITIASDAAAILDLTKRLDACENPPPPPPGQAMLGSAPSFVPSNGAVEPKRHIYNRVVSGVTSWNGTLAGAGILTFRFDKKPSIRVTSSIAADVLAGGKDAMIDSLASDLMILTEPVIVSVWHEPLRDFEFLVGEPLSVWSDAIEYVMTRVEAQGVTNARWAPCLTGEQYANGQGDQFFTASLLNRAYALGGDAYLELATPTPETDHGWQGFANFHPELKHIVLEWGLRDSFGVTGVQPPAIESVSAWVKTHPNYVGVTSWFNSGPHDNRLNPDGVAAYEIMCADPLFSRSVIGG